MYRKCPVCGTNEWRSYERKGNLTMSCVGCGYKDRLRMAVEKLLKDEKAIERIAEESFKVMTK
jgi:uncharacterized Zn finger protein